jgi:hypothetical protein
MTQDRGSLRGRFEFPVMEHQGGFSFWRTALDISPTGILIEAADEAWGHEASLVQLDLHLPGLSLPVRVLASPVWSRDERLGLKFVDISDADRLTLAEQLDRYWQRGGRLH